MAQTPELDLEGENERKAFDALSREFRPSLIRFFSKRIKETAEVEDLVQEVFVRLAKRSSLADLESQKAYVFQTASSVLNDWGRRRNVRCANQHDEFNSDHHGGVDFTPERVLESKEEFAQVEAILMELPARTRTVFVLRRLEGLRYKDIALRIGISVSAVEKHITRAAMHLRKRLGER